ncbi:MAG: SGNH/GDSL hydrolase family protein [Planctomycetia bacterium]|nr:SGNH/GDSL hydrolase family protein [Planctomycetia bacterium]
MLRRDFLTLSLAGTVACAMPNVLTVAADDADAKPNFSLENVVSRGDYQNARYVFETKKQGTVAFLGGSITEMDGYRPMVCEDLKRRFPSTKFDFVAAGIGSTCSDVGAYRFASDVLDGHNAPDLFFVEFAVNDDQDGGFSYEHAVRGMEGVIRQVRRVNPNVDIVMTFFVNENLMERYRRGEEATSIQAHKAVAAHYGISTINLAREIQQEIDAGTITWQEFGGVHPAPRGNRICADMIKYLLDNAWKLAPAKQTVAHELPKCLDPNSYYGARYLSPESYDLDHGFSYSVPDWSKIPGSFRMNFAGKPCLCATEPGAETTIKFNGNALALYVLAGPDAGMVECAIDDAQPTLHDCFHSFSRGLHYPRAVALVDALEQKEHVAKIRILERHNENSTGNAVRILHVCVNDASVDK